MSNRKDPYLCIWWVCVLCVLAVCPIAGQDDAGDPVLDFYTQRAASVFRSADPMQAGTTYSFRATSYYLKLEAGRPPKRVDSSVVDFYFSFDQLDSLIVQTETSDRFDLVDLSIPPIFEGPYFFNFFPNDTGGTEIAIGFDTDSTNTTNPTGLAILNRDRCTLERIYLCYPNVENHRRFSRGLRLTTVNGRVYPDSAWIIGARYGIFSTDHYRIETRIDSLKVYSP